MLKEIRRGYVDARLPGLESYAYQAELISVGDGYYIMLSILRRIDFIRWPRGDHPWFHLLGEAMDEGSWHYIGDADAFPQPTSDSLEEGSDED